MKNIFNQGFEARFPLPLQLSPQLCLGYLTSTVTNVQYKCTVQVYTVHPASAVITPVTSRISDIANPSIRRHNIGQKFTLAPRAPLTPLFPMWRKIVSAQMSAEFIELLHIFRQFLSESPVSSTVQCFFSYAVSYTFPIIKFRYS